MQLLVVYVHVLITHWDEQQRSIPAPAAAARTRTVPHMVPPGSLTSHSALTHLTHLHLLSVRLWLLHYSNDDVLG